MQLPKLLSLWEVVNLFDVYSLVHILHKFAQVQAALSLPKLSGQGNTSMANFDNTRMSQAMDEAETFFQVMEMPDGVQAVRIARQQWGRPMLDVSGAFEIVHRVQVDITTALDKRLFLRVADDRVRFVAHMRGNEAHGGTGEVFGYPTLGAFPSSERDIDEAGNCLAAECNTAAVFHLMRVAEVGLRALANDRNAPFKSQPIEQQQWGTILAFLDGEVKRLRLADAKNWKNPGMKDVQVRFYGEVVAELRAFNEAWRRHISHAREDGTYDRDYAKSVFTHVKAFMQKLAERITEQTNTPEYWER